MNANELLSAGRELEALRKFRAEVESALGRLDESLHPSDVQPPPPSPNVEVLVRRTSGPKPTIFHRADDPCRRVTGEGRSLESFTRQARSRAEVRGLRPCSSCTWPRVPEVGA